MAKIPLIIDKNYCSDWGVFQGIRELLQNAKDADEDGHTMTIEHFPRTERLEVSSAKIYVDPAKLLILGKSDKQPGQKRGQYGEGFVLGCLALMRKGCDVSFRNGELSWSVSFEEPDPPHPFAGNELLTFKSRQLAAREQDFRVEIGNVPVAVWDVIKKLFLFLVPPLVSDTMSTPHGTLLLHPDYEGKVFSRGIFVKAFKNLSCGYDMTELKLDRDRNALDEWELHYKLGRVWKDACETHPELAAPRLYAMAEKGSVEASNVKYHADDRILKDVRARYEAKHGVDSVPVATMEQAKDVESVGGKPTMVNEVLKELLEKGGLTIDAAKKSLEGQIEARHVFAEIPGKDWPTLNRLIEIVPEFIPVTFKGKAACRLIDDDKKVGFDIRLLAEPFGKALKLLVNTEARRRGVEPVDILIEHAARVSAVVETPAACDECGQTICDGPSLISADHSTACSLYPHGDASPPSA